MSPQQGDYDRDDTSFPRLRGDEPAETTKAPLSPGVFPAYAGMSRAVCVA